MQTREQLVRKGRAPGRRSGSATSCLALCAHRLSLQKRTFRNASAIGDGGRSRPDVRDASPETTGIGAGGPV